MPRDGSGNYTLPAGNPVVTNTIITSTWANTTLADIAAQLNNVFTRDGLLGPTAPFKIMDGTVAAPGLAWNSEPGMGWFRSAAGEISTAVGGARTSRLSSSTVGSTELRLSPRAGQGASSLVLETASTGGTTNIQILQQADGQAVFAANSGGGNTNKSLTFSGFTGVAYNMGIAAPTVRWGPSGLGSGTLLTFSGNDPILQFSPGYYWQWESANGRLNYVRNNAAAPNTIFHPNGDFIAGGDIYVGGGDSLSLRNNVAGGVKSLFFTTDGWKLEWVGSNGSLYFYNPSGTTLFGFNTAQNWLQSNGGMQCNGNAYNANNISSAAVYAHPGSGFNFSPDGGYSSGPIYCMVAQGNPSWNQMYFRFSHMQGQWAGMELFNNAAGNGNMHFKVSGNAICDGAGPGGNWNCSISGFGYTSDERFKENIADAIDVVTRFRNIRYREFNRIGQARREIGVIAQELLPHEPNALFFDDDNDAIPVAGPPVNPVPPQPDLTGVPPLETPPDVIVDPLQYRHRYMLRPDHVHFLAGAALQAALTIIDDLQARVAALEATP